MKMQDNEFDELFRSRLDSFETEPSAEVWKNVDNELNSHKRKKILTPFLSIAASVIVFVTAGILFIPQKGNVKPGNHPVNNNIVKVIRPFNTPQVVRNHPNTNILNSDKTNKTSIVANRIDRGNAIKSTKHALAEKLITLKVEQNKPGKTDDPALLASNPQTQQNIIKGVVPDERTQIAINPHIEETTSFITKPSLVAAEIPAINKPDIIPQDIASVKSKHKIHSLGDLINVVVAKVDKRKDKIIEFTDTDDESNITGVNLGIIKIKKEK
jgi:hypothetical protein